MLLTQEAASQIVLWTLVLTEKDVHPDTGELRSCDDEQWTMVNTRCEPHDLPEELRGWAERVGLPRGVLVPKCILAMYALGLRVPPKQKLFPEDKEDL